MKRIYTFALLVLLAANFASARTIYVSTTGIDTNPGTETSPYLNIQKAVDEAAPGDMIYLRVVNRSLPACLKPLAP